MKKLIYFVVYGLLSIFICDAQGNDIHVLRSQLSQLISGHHANIGIALKNLENGDTLTLNNTIRYPMQSVYKFPLAIAVLHQVDRGKMTLNQKIHIGKKELRTGTWSPMRDKYPDGNIDLTLAELLNYTVSQSDNNGCDILFRLMGGAAKVEKYIHGLGFNQVGIKYTEEEMHRKWEAQFDNAINPFDMVQLLEGFFRQKYLSDTMSRFLMNLMIESTNSPKRIKGLLPAETVVAHKTGTSGSNNKGITAAVNDIGIITLPDQRHIAIAVFITNSSEAFDTNERIIARIAKTVFDFYSKDASRLEDSISFIMDSAYAASPFFGNILITRHDHTMYEKSFGYADAINHKPLTVNNSFQVASISKQFTAYGIMLLKSKGLLEYDSAVTRYIPSFPYSNITLRHLLTHTSGLPNFWDQIRPYLDTMRSNGNKDVLAYLINHKMPLQFVPGSKFDYCDIGYDFLATIIENVSGMSYEEFMEKNIFNPLGMKNSHAYMVTDIRRISNHQLAIGHVYENGTFSYAHLEPKYNFVSYLGDFYGDGSVVTTARDLALWDKALKEGTLLPSHYQNESITPARLNDSSIYIRPNLSYGFGWFIRSTPSGKLVYHSGGHPGNSHVIYRLMNKDLTFIFLSNAETNNLRALRNRVLQLLSKE